MALGEKEGAGAIEDSEAGVADDASTLVLTVAYNGSRFAGFARQEGLATVQGELERALSTVLRRPAEVTCAGRTDAGVHALGQVVSLPITATEKTVLAGRAPGGLLRSLGALTADGISIRDARFERPGFSARFDATSREYRYRIMTGPFEPVFLREFSWWVHGGALDAEAMARASRCLVGEHDFRSFCQAKSAEGKATCRCVTRIDFGCEEIMGERCLSIAVEGNAFLHNMIRIIVGTLVEVGAGRRPPEWVARVLADRDRRAAGPTAPAAGLVFQHVSYEGVRIHP